MLGLKNAAVGVMKNAALPSKCERNRCSPDEVPFMALLLLLCISPAQPSVNFFALLNFYTCIPTSVPQALTPIFKIEFWVVTATGTVAPILVTQRDS